jgi:hypothetical protein
LIDRPTKRQESPLKLAIYRNRFISFHRIARILPDIRAEQKLSLLSIITIIMPRYVLLLRSTSATEAGKAPTTEQLQAIAAFREATINAGVYLGAEGLMPTNIEAHRVKFNSDGSAPKVKKGPFDKDESLSSWFMIETNDVKEAVEWAKILPLPNGTVEVRRVIEPEDMGQEFLDIMGH